ncbi:hypothetical protein ACLB2K_061416 [Fragaria x ananassa]
MKWANAYLSVGTITILVESFDAINMLMIGGNVSLPVETLTTPSLIFDAIDTYRKLLKLPFNFSHVVVDVTTLHSETSASSPDLRHGIHQALTRALIPTDRCGSGIENKPPTVTQQTPKIKTSKLEG